VTCPGPRSSVGTTLQPNAGSTFLKYKHLLTLWSSSSSRGVAAPGLVSAADPSPTAVDGQQPEATSTVNPFIYDSPLTLYEKVKVRSIRLCDTHTHTP
jgi:hypothetical protein